MKYRENSLDFPVNGRKSPISHRFYDDLPVNGRLFRESLEKNARRNMLAHGHIIVGVPGQLTFVKSSILDNTGFNAKKSSFTEEGLIRHINALTESTNRLQRLLGVTDDDMQNLANAALFAAK